MGHKKYAQNFAFHKKNSTRRKGTHRSRVVRLFSFLFHLEFEDQSGQSSSSHFIFWGLLEETKKKRSRLLLSFSVQWSFSWLCCSSSLLLPPTTIHDSASGLIDALRQNWREIKVLFRVWNEQNREPNSRKSSLSENPKHYYCLLPCQGTFSQSPFNRVRLDRLEVVTTVPRGFPIFLFSFVQKILHILQFSLISKDKKNAARSNPF